MSKRFKIILIIFAVYLIGTGFWYFSNIQKGKEAQKKEVPAQITSNLKLLTSHSNPQTGEEWVVSFETIGTSDLTITPGDPDSIGDLDLLSLKCGKEEKTPQILEGDVVLYPNWQCLAKGELTHLVNIARKHTLKFQFGEKLAFAHNNPDSVTDSFTDTSKISATSSVVITGGQVKLVKTNGTACSSGSECGSGYCVDNYCCNTACGGTCQACVLSKTGSATGTCANITSNTDPDSECAGACSVCQSGSCGNATIDSQPTGCTGCNWCDSNGNCKACAYGDCTIISFCLGGDYPIVDCKPSRAGTTALDVEGCWGWGGKVNGTQYDKCCRHTCACP